MSNPDLRIANIFKNSLSSTMFDRETNITRYQHNVLEFVLANQQRNLFFCQNEDDRQLDFLKKHPRLQFIPWSHCDQVRVPNRLNFQHRLSDRDYLSMVWLFEPFVKFMSRQIILYMRTSKLGTIFSSDQTPSVKLEGHFGDSHLLIYHSCKKILMNTGSMK